ncbi:MAG: hypothetical protein P4L46_13120 [Fimbriimonas sp.]|nr:hypothetical protein [Fimbriimonas sp.]
MNVESFVRWHLRLSLIEPSVEDAQSIVFSSLSNVVLNLDLCTLTLTRDGETQTWRFRDVHSSALIYLLMKADKRITMPFGSVLREFSRAEGDAQCEFVTSCAMQTPNMTFQPFRPGEPLEPRTYYWFPVGVWTNKIGVSEHLSYAFVAPSEDLSKMVKLATSLRGRTTRVVEQVDAEPEEGVPIKRLAISSYVGRGK